jgi:hypothetical protein
MTYPTLAGDRPRPDIENDCGHDTGGFRVMLGES